MNKLVHLYDGMCSCVCWWVTHSPVVRPLLVWWPRRSSYTARTILAWPVIAGRPPLLAGSLTFCCSLTTGTFEYIPHLRHISNNIFQLNKRDDFIQWLTLLVFSQDLHLLPEKVHKFTNWLLELNLRVYIQI